MANIALNLKQLVLSGQVLWLFDSIYCNLTVQWIVQIKTTVVAARKSNDFHGNSLIYHVHGIVKVSDAGREHTSEREKIMTA